MEKKRDSFNKRTRLVTFERQLQPQPPYDATPCWRGLGELSFFKNGKNVWNQKIPEATFVKVSKHLTDVQFILIGKFSDNSMEHLKKMATSNVKFTGYLSDEALLQYYQRAKVYCQLSTQESFGIALAEAMSCGCVPVVTRKYSLPEVAGDTGFCAPYNDPKATAEAIRGALESDKGMEARERIKTFFSLEAREKGLVREILDLTKNS